MWKLLIVLLFMLFGCGHKSDDEDNNPSSTPYTSTSAAYVPPLQDRLAKTLLWSNTCNITACDGNGETGDALLWNGLLCSSGYQQSCDAALAAQGPDGRFYRSEFRNPGPNSFSRDMALGALLYLLQSGNQESAKAWLSYIKASGGKLCTDDTDGRCLMTVNIWSLMGTVWDYIGLEKSFEMKVAGVLTEPALNIEANTVSLGYQMHLVAVSLLIRKLAGKELSSPEKTLISRQPNNPFFRYLLEGPSDVVSNRVLEVCPTSAPADRSDWAWQRDTAQEAWKNSAGWDCVFMLRELLK